MSRSQWLPWQHIKRREAAFSFQSQLLERGQACGAESRVGMGNSLYPHSIFTVNHIPLPGASLPSTLLRKLGSRVSISQVRSLGLESSAWPVGSWIGFLISKPALLSLCLGSTDPKTPESHWLGEYMYWFAKPNIYPGRFRHTYTQAEKPLELARVHSEVCADT